jgi:hypothetical protein
MTGIETALLAVGVGAKTAATVGTAASIASGVGAAASALGSIQEGRSAAASGKFQAKQYEMKAKQEQAIAQRRGLEQRRQIELASSRAKAISAASGVSSASPTVANILADLDREADYAFDTNILAGNEAAEGLRTAADVQVLAGRQARQAGLYGALTGVSQFAAMSAFPKSYRSSSVKKKIGVV